MPAGYGFPSRILCLPSASVLVSPPPLDIGVRESPIALTSTNRWLFQSPTVSPACFQQHMCPTPHFPGLGTFRLVCHGFHSSIHHTAGFGQYLWCIIVSHISSPWISSPARHTQSQWEKEAPTFLLPQMLIIISYLQPFLLQTPALLPPKNKARIGSLR